MLRKLLKFLFLFLLTSSPAWATACTNSTFGSFSCVQTCGVFANPGTSVSCVMSSNVTSGNTIVAHMFGFSGTANLLSVTTGSCTPVTLTQQDQVNDSTNSVSLATEVGKASSTGACTITGHCSVSTTCNLKAVEISGSNGTVDKHSMSANASTTITAGNPISPPAITTTVNGDLILEIASDPGANFATWTANSGTIMVDDTAQTGTVIQGQTQATAGSVTPSVKYSVNNDQFAAAIALEKSGGGTTSPPPTQMQMGVGAQNFQVTQPTIDAYNAATCTQEAFIAKTCTMQVEVCDEVNCFTEQPGPHTWYVYFLTNNAQPYLAGFANVTVQANPQ